MKKDVKCFIGVLFIMLISLSALYFRGRISQLCADAIVSASILIFMQKYKLLPSVFYILSIMILSKIFQIINFPIAILSVTIISNIIFVTLYYAISHIFAKNSVYQKIFTYFTSSVISSAAKFLCLYLIIDKNLLNNLEINENINYSFGITQLYSSLIACVIAIIFYEISKKES